MLFDFLNKEGLAHLINKILKRDVDITQEEYDKLPDSKYSDGVNYYIIDADTSVTAEEVGYDGSTSGSSASNSQQALDELFAANKTLNSNLTDRISFPTNERTLLASAFQSGYEYISNNDITLNVTFQPQGSASSNAYMSIIIYNEQGNAVNAVQNSYPHTVSTINILSIQMKKGQKAVINYTNCNTASNTLMLHGAI